MPGTHLEAEVGECLKSCRVLGQEGGQVGALAPGEVQVGEGGEGGGAGGQLQARVIAGGEAPQAGEYGEGVWEVLQGGNKGKNQE